MTYSGAENTNDPNEFQLPDTGPLKFSDIQEEFGGSNPISLSEYYGAQPDIPNSGEISVSDFYGERNFIRSGSKVYTGTSARYWYVPDGVNEIHILCIGAGGAGGNSVFAGAGGAGGNLTYTNFIAVTPGERLILQAGTGGVCPPSRSSGTSGTPSLCTRASNNEILCYAGGGHGGEGGGGAGVKTGGAAAAHWGGQPNTTSVQGGFGGNSKDDSAGGGGGAAGYEGRGGDGINGDGTRTGDSYGGGGGGSLGSSANFTPDLATYRGGGVGINGPGTNGTGGTSNSPGGKGGSGGSNGDINNRGGMYGAGSAGIGNDDDKTARASSGANGCVKVIWGTDTEWPWYLTN